jgi:DNA-binding GntR family transcriptional regulator
MSESVFSEIAAEPRSRVASRAIREAIVAGRLAPGQNVNEVDLAKQLGVSRAPLREALRALEKEGLVSHVPYKGTVVAPLTRQGVGELQSLRRVLEVFAVEQWIHRANESDIDGLDAIVDEMERAVRTTDVARMNEIDIEFHSRVIELSGHHLLQSVWQNYVSRIRRVLTLRNLVNSDPSTPVVLHRDLVDAFRARDLQAIRRCYEAHGADAALMLSNYFTQDDQVSQSEEIVIP